jgi:hypothetical protein
MVYGSRFRVQGLWFMVYGSRFRVSGSEFMGYRLWVMVLGVGCRA